VTNPVAAVETATASAEIKESCGLSHFRVEDDYASGAVYSARVAAVRGAWLSLPRVKITRAVGCSGCDTLVFMVGVPLMVVALAFLAPALVKAAIAGRLPRGIGVTRLRDAPVECGDGQALSWRWRWRTRRGASPGR
jgi:hypothetical protein